MEEVYVVAACRTPIGKMGGALKSLTVADLSSVVFKDILKRGNITADMVDEIKELNDNLENLVNITRSQKKQEENAI